MLINSNIIMSDRSLPYNRLGLIWLDISNPDIPRLRLYSGTDWISFGGGGSGEGGPVSWIDVLGKPTSFTPTIHNHSISDISNLQTTLNSKANSVHAHSSVDIVDFPTQTNSTELIAGVSTVGKLISAEALKVWINSKGFSTQTLVAGTGITIIGNVISSTGGVTNVTWNTVQNKPSWIGDIKPAYTKSEIGLSNVDNVADINKPISSATQNALNTKAALVHTHTISQVSDFPTRTNLIAGANITITEAGSDITIASTGGGGSGAVSSVNAKTGAVVINKGDVGLANVDNTSDASKPISIATQNALVPINQKLNDKVNLDDISTSIESITTDITEVTTDILEVSKDIQTVLAPVAFSGDYGDLQNKLVAGANITITGNIIASTASGGGGTDITFVQTGSGNVVTSVEEAAGTVTVTKGNVSGTGHTHTISQITDISTIQNDISAIEDDLADPISLTSIPGYNSTVKQYLTHDASGVLQWANS